MIDAAKLLDNEDDFAAKANSDVAQLCAECILYWRRTLSTANQPAVHSLLAKKHHTLRVKRFAEGFFTVDNPRHLASGSVDSNYQNYAAICEMARRSKYLSSLPMLPVHCVPLDGDATSLPMIFEDKYQDTSNQRRRSGSDPHINGGKCTKVKSPAPGKTKECSCGISSYNLEPLPKLSNNMIGVMTPRFALGGEILQASLTIIPAAAQNGLRGKTLSRHSVATMLEPESFKDVYVAGGGTLPTRHSKSLDQLETQNNLNSTSSLSRHPNNMIMPKPQNHHQHHKIQNSANNVNSSSNSNNSVVSVINANIGPNNLKSSTKQAEDLLKNINEFKEKYKNPGDPTKNLQRLQNDLHMNGHVKTEVKQSSNPIFPKEIHVSSNNILTLNRITMNSNKHNQKTDYVHELKHGNISTPHCYYNSLPKGAGTGIQPRNSYPPIRGKKSGPSPRPTKVTTNTIPRSNSSQALKKNGGVSPPQKNMEFARVRVSDFKKMMNNNTNGHESSSTDSGNITPRKRKLSRRLLSSASVPFKLELLEMEDNVGISESLPNLAPPPAAFSNSPPTVKSRRRSSCTESTSSLSDQSGFVSSRRSSGPSSPETVQNEQGLINGEQLRMKLQKFLIEQPQRKASIERKKPNKIQMNNGTYGTITGTTGKKNSIYNYNFFVYFTLN